MKWPFWRIAPEALLGLALVGAACDPDNSVKPGPPVLLSLTVDDGVAGSSYALTDDAGAVAVPPFVHVTALFDRLLDPNGLTNIDGGVDLGGDAAMVTATPGPTPPWMAIYTPNGGDLHLAFPPGPSIVVSGNPVFPSSSTITVMLDKSKVHSKGGDPFTGAGDLQDGRVTFTTQPFTATIAVPMSDAPADPDAGADAGPPAVAAGMQPVTVTFNSLPGATAASFITVTADGAPFTALTIGSDPSGNPTMLDVIPVVSWPANATIVIEVAATLPDALGAPLGVASSATFTTGGS